MTTTTCPTLLTTPAENARCARCDVAGVRYPGDEATYPHCPSCGSTELTDDRSPFEVAREALWLAKADDLTPEQVIGRWDDFERIFTIARAADAYHCGDCTEQARRLDVAMIALGVVVR